MSPIFYALFSNIAFATGSIYFTRYAQRTSSIWMNFAKASVACLGFLGTLLVLGDWNFPDPGATTLLCVSGLIGLMVGDIFLIKAFTHLGSGRVLMIFGFQPLILGVFSYFLFGQSFALFRLVAVLFFVACLLIFSLESFRQKGHWDVVGLSCALLGVVFDAVGILLTRTAFEHSPQLTPVMANFIRSAMAVAGFVFVANLPKVNFKLIHHAQSLSDPEKIGVVGASFLGTFMSLSFYLVAVQRGHLATISAIAGTSPLFATLIETLMGRKKFTKYLFWGLAFFIAGVGVLTFG